MTEFELMEWIKPVKDPDVGYSLVDLGLIYKAELRPDGHVQIEMTLTTPLCPSAPQMVEEIKQRVKEHPDCKSVDVEIVWEPKWDPAMHASEEIREALGLW